MIPRSRPRPPRGTAANKSGPSLNGGRPVRRDRFASMGLAYGLYTRKGSGINKHPGPDSSDPIVGDETKAESKDLQDQRAGVDQTESAELDQRGTK